MKLTKQQRAELKMKFGGHCAYCGDQLGDKWHADHIEAVKRDFDMKKCEKTGYMIPVSNGVLFRPQNDTLENMNPSCVPCNINKSSMPLESWRRSIAHYRDVQLLRDSTHARHLHRFGLIEIKPDPVVFFLKSGVLMTDLIIGIDPDLEKSGVAVLGQSLELKNLTFPETVELFRTHQDEIKKVVIEAGWLNEKSNFRFGHSKNAGEKIAKNVGENHATGKLLAEMAKECGLAVVLVKPTRTKLKAEDFNRITGWQGRTNQEQRDAGMLIWGMK